jgi:ribosomal protein S18 acetylase RimI-like enzyme
MEKKSRAAYAADKEKEGYTPEDSIKVANESFDRLLPQGRETPDQYIYKICEGDKKIGILWWGKQKKGTKEHAWIYDIAIEEKERGKGYGRAAMLAAEADARAKNMHELGLHVFGHNEIARNLYDSMGFRTTNIIMSKQL